MAFQGEEDGGCSRILGMVVMLGLLGMALDKLGCVATEDSLRRGVSISIADQEDPH